MEKKTKVNLLAVQMGSIIADKLANLNKVESLLENSLSNYSADIVFLPEVWNVGWDCQSFPLAAEDLNSSVSIKMLQTIAKKYSTNLVGGSIILRKDNSELVNACPVINRKGELICVYEKNHLFSYYGCDEGKYITAGANPIMANLDGINVGISICYDIRFPEIYRAYRQAGADLLVNMAAWGAEKKIPWDSMTTSRAVENQTYFVALTQTGQLREGTNLGHSMILDYKGETLSEINKEEGCIYATIDLEEMYIFRDKCKVLEDIKDSYEVIVK